MAEIGITSNIEHYRCIKHPLWEMKAGALRAMFFEDASGIHVITGGFHKPTPKMQRAEFSRAQDLMDIYFEEKRRGLNRVILDQGESSFVRVPSDTRRQFNDTIL